MLGNTTSEIRNVVTIRKISKICTIWGRTAKITKTQNIYLLVILEERK